MHSFLIVSKIQKAALEYAVRNCKESKIDKFDISILTFEKSIGIEDIRNFQKKLVLKPLRSKAKAVILDGSKDVTIEAQNALLKTLEEPPSNTIIYIIISNKDLVLPTILSRCQVIELRDKEYKLSKDEEAQYLNILTSLSSCGVGDRLKLAQDVAKNKQESIPELEKMIIAERQKLINSVCHSEHREESLEILRLKPQDDNAVHKYLNILISLNKTYALLKTTNVNSRLALENLFLNL